jgi:HAMP domain-containing protein
MFRTTVLLVAAGLGALGIGAWASSAQTGPALIRITSTQTRYALVDLGRSRTGDTEFIRQKLFNRKITQKPIGRAEVVCTFTFGKARVCRGTYFLAKGKLVVGGSISNRDIYELAITGGTGLYNNARGTFTAIRTAKGPRREFLIFRLAG